VKSRRKLWKLPAICVEANVLAALAEEAVEVGWGGVPENTGLLGVGGAGVMSAPPNPDVHAAACSKRASITSSGDGGGNGVFVGDDQSLRVGSGVAAVVLAR